jgi:hypothetical protein
MEKKEKVFADGFIFKRNDNAPEFVIGNISIKSEDAIAFIQKHTKKGWVNLKINKSQGGKAYIELDTWEAKGEPISTPFKAAPINDSDLPF